MALPRVCTGLLAAVLVGAAMAQPANICRAGSGLPAAEELLFPREGLSLEATLTQSGGTVISLQELRSRKALPQGAWKLYNNACKADRKGEYEVAEALTDDALRDAPGFFEAHAGLAVLRLRQGAIESAEEQLVEALRIDPNYLPGRELLGIVTLLKGDASSALKILKGVLATDPGRAAAHYFMGRALCQLGQAQGAVKHFETARELRRHPVQPQVDEEESERFPID